MQTETGRTIASCFALAAFAVAIFAGLAGENAAAQILLRAVTAMIICYPVGLIVGLVCDNLIRSHTLADSLDAAAQAAESAGTNIETGATQDDGAARSDAGAMKSRAAA